MAEERQASTLRPDGPNDLTKVTVTAGQTQRPGTKARRPRSPAAPLRPPRAPRLPEAPPGVAQGPTRAGFRGSTTDGTRSHGSNPRPTGSKQQAAAAVGARTRFT